MRASAAHPKVANVSRTTFDGPGSAYHMSDERAAAMTQYCVALLLTSLASATGAAGTWFAIHRHDLAGGRRPWRWHHPPVEVLVADRRQRRQLERAIRAAIRQLDRAHSGAATASALVVQRIVWDDWGGAGGRQIHGCARRPARFAADPPPRFCLALEVDGRELPLDEILAALADLWSLHLTGDDREFVPIVLGPTTDSCRISATPAPQWRTPSPLTKDN
jgi:hypothetical protein